MTRREFLQTSALLATGAEGAISHQMVKLAPAPKLVRATDIAHFVDPLPIPPVAKPRGYQTVASHSNRLPLYRINMAEFQCKVHRDIPSTTFWGYEGSVPGPTIETRSGEGIVVEWANELPSEHFLPIDHKLMGAETYRPEVRTIVHVHGGKVPPASDGYPENWFVPGKSVRTEYPNEQPSALLWYHDHAMGITRLNMIAGLFGLYVVRDPFEDNLHLPSGEFEIPLVLFDRLIRTDGRLYYPVSQNPDSPWVPEFVGDCVLVNGKVLPYLEVKPGKYRVRFLNASNARFFSLALSNDLAFHQIGTDQGLLPAPVEVPNLMLIPGERADLIIDFSAHASSQIVLQDGVVPIMQFRVSRETARETTSLPKALRPVEKLSEASAFRTRVLTLEEFDNLLAEPVTHLLNGKRWHDPVTENPVLDSVEIWSLFNLTDDAHPIHLHLVRFQILDRQALDVPEYVHNKRVRYTGDRVPPDPNECGWKDTVRAAPNAVTRILIKFEGYAGRYVWHCHIAEHEDNEMMRPYDIVCPAAPVFPPS